MPHQKLCVRVVVMVVDVVFVDGLCVVVSCVFGVSVFNEVVVPVGVCVELGDFENVLKRALEQVPSGDVEQRKKLQSFGTGKKLAKRVRR